MPIKNGRKQSPKEILASVAAEMAKPRVAESAKGAGARARRKYTWTAPSAKKCLLRPSRGAQLLEARN